MKAAAHFSERTTLPLVDATPFFLKRRASLFCDRLLPRTCIDCTRLGQDFAERDGRRSWSDPSGVLAHRPYLRTKTVVRARRGKAV